MTSAPVHLALMGRARARRTDLETYRDKAIAPATDPAASSLFDPVAAARSLEAAYDAMFEGRQAGLPPAAIDL